MTPAKIARVTLLAAAAGATNAWLCFAGIPVPVEDDPTFKWHVIPAGALHGGILALVPLAAFSFLVSKGLVVRIVIAPAVGWVAAYLAWVPLNRSVFDEGWAKSLGWPFEDASLGGVILGPFVWFGFVALAYYLALVLLSRKNMGLLRYLFFAAASGVLGSLWWWISWKPWYFSVIHGSIWGIAVGLGTWTALRSR